MQAAQGLNKPNLPVKCKVKMGSEIHCFCNNLTQDTSALMPHQDACISDPENATAADHLRKDITNYGFIHIFFLGELKNIQL